jgi:hypothetical protein
MSITLANINIGTGPGVGDGDPLRTAFNKINNNFASVQSNLNTSTTVPLNLISPGPVRGNSLGSSGQVAVTGGNLYLCIAPNTWVKTSVITSF